MCLFHDFVLIPLNPKQEAVYSSHWIRSSLWIYEQLLWKHNPDKCIVHDLRNLSYCWHQWKLLTTSREWFPPFSDTMYILLWYFVSISVSEIKLSISDPDCRYWLGRMPLQKLFYLFELFWYNRILVVLRLVCRWIACFFSLSNYRK